MLFFVCISANAQNTRDLALELLEVTNSEELHNQTIQSYIDNFSKDPKFATPEFQEFMWEAMGWDALKEPMIKVMEENYTVEELRTLVAFMKSDVGQSFIRKSPKVNAEMVGIITKNIKAVISRYNSK